jgi:endonuclease/exonuclease/phosphatase family metal-dependent hydrolase
MAADATLLAAVRRPRDASGFYDSAHPVVLAGDFNVVPTDLDIYNTRSWKKHALLQPASREAYWEKVDPTAAKGLRPSVVRQSRARRSTRKEGSSACARAWAQMRLRSRLLLRLCYFRVSPFR